MDAERFVELLDRKRRVGVDAAIAFELRPVGGGDQRVGIVELRHQAVGGRRLRRHRG
jgi:hypothetical protein